MDQEAHDPVKRAEELVKGAWSGGLLCIAGEPCPLAWAHRGKWEVYSGTDDGADIVASGRGGKVDAALAVIQARGDGKITLPDDE